MDLPEAGATVAVAVHSINHQCDDRTTMIEPKCGKDIRHDTDRMEQLGQSDYSTMFYGQSNETCLKNTNCKLFVMLHYKTGQN